MSTKTTKTTKRKRASAPATPVAPQAAETAPVVQSDVAQPAEAASAPVATSAMPTIGLASHCTVKDATALKTQLLQLLDEPASVAIDAKSVERVDTAVVQLLCAFVRDRAQRGSGVTWLGAPPPLLDAARLLGVGALLALPQEAST